ncbi:LysR family transcriptional regulator [Humitalea sp. 24SJ18S-53]|uniref:LysR family transcriptional regulator n=1 Tax=Humitalea sp. 24SJ18S-53 TaxID=3422307 RepID=UPI003D67EC46
MNLRQMEVFHAIMRTGSVTGAARLLGVTQPSVSTVLKHCETSMKMRLFERVGGRLRATPEAQAIYPDVAAVFGRLDAVGRLTADLAGGRLGTLSVAAAFPIANGYLAKAVASFLEDRPNIRVVLQSLTSPQVVDRVVSREVELGIAHEPVDSPEVETEVLARSGLACVLREDHPLASRAEIEVRDLEPYPLITYLPQTLFRLPVDRALAQAGIAPRISVQVSFSLTGIILAYHGAGIALVEPYLLESMPLPGLLARPLLPRIEFSALLVRARSAPRSRLMDHFVTHLRQVVGA